MDLCTPTPYKTQTQNQLKITSTLLQSNLDECNDLLASSPWVEAGLTKQLHYSLLVEFFKKIVFLVAWKPGLLHRRRSILSSTSPGVAFSIPICLTSPNPSWRISRLTSSPYSSAGALARRLDLDDKDVHELALLSCRGSLSPASASSRGFGFVSFRTTEDAQSTLEASDGVVCSVFIQGNVVQCPLHLFISSTYM